MDGAGVPYQALQKARAVDTLAMSQPVLDELLDVLRRPCLARFLDADLCAVLLDQMVSGTHWFEPPTAVTDCRDPADNKYLELALAARAHTIVSSDRDLLILHPWRGIPLLRPADYLARNPDGTAAQPARSLPPAPEGHTYYQIVHSLRGSLPPPVSDSPEDLAHRDNAAIAQVASLLPGNADEVELAAQYVAAGAHARDCQRLAQEYRGDHKFFLQCHAHAISMLRLAQSARRLLQRVQAERCKREADNVTRDRAAWTEHCAIGLMADALTGVPSAAIAEPPPPPEPPAPEPAQDEEPVIDPVAAAEEYALIYPRRAALIRRLGRLPDNPSFGPPDDDLVRALVASRTPAMLALDREASEVAV